MLRPSGRVAETVDERVALLVATMSAFLTPFMGSSANVALPAIARDLAIDALGLSWVATSFLLAAAVCLVPFGRLADIHGRRRVFTSGLAVYTAGSFLSAVAPSAPALIGARVVQGTGGAMMFGTNVAILSSVFPPWRRGAALGVNVAAVYLGLSLGPVLGGLITEQLGWRSLFHLNAGLGAITALVTASRLRGEWAEARGERFDIAGSLAYMIALAALMFGLSRLPGPGGAAWMAAGMVSLAAFVHLELRVPSPVLDVRLFLTNRVFALSNLAALINYSATFAVGFLLSLYLQYVRGLGPQAAGIVLVCQPVVQAAISPFAGRLSDRVESRLLASTGMALTAVGLALAALLRADTSIGYVVGCLGVLGTGFGLFSSPNTNAVMSAVEPRRYGLAGATLATMRLAGQMLSMGAAMLVLAAFVGPVPIGPEHRGALVAAARTAFAGFAALCVAGTAASLARGTVRGSPP
jgi:EmrB/QacA subfamily drug resistance transporter